MPTTPLSEHCSLMAQPSGPATTTVRPADCPKDAAYIKTVGKGGAMTIPGDAAFPIVVEGGDGDDKVTVIGSGPHGVLVSGGRGNDSLLVEDRGVWLAQQLGPGGLLLTAALAIVCATLAAVAWRMLAHPRR